MLSDSVCPGGSPILESAVLEVIWGQDGSDPGAKRNEEVREYFKFSFSLGCCENWVGNGRGDEGHRLPLLLSAGQEGGGCKFRHWTKQRKPAFGCHGYRGPGRGVLL